MHLFSRREWVERGGGGIVCEMVVLDMETYISYDWLCIHLSYHTIVPVATFSHRDAINNARCPVRQYTTPKRETKCLI
jgi:hypothetical protein